MSLRSIGIIFLFIVVIIMPGAWGMGIDYVALRVGFPLGELPFLVGVDIGTELSFGWGVASLLLSPDGRTLLLVSLEYTLGDAEGKGESLVRLTTGVSYFDLGATFPSPLIGGGLAYKLFFEGGLWMGITGDILYPLALGPPFITLESGWSP